ncbi:MAG: CBS domain-containing protein [Thermoplasmata archaeon]|nr:MAG: CBS domain-containing protein [Thermoplasmata archaeon]RLF47497.1 MAG: CBS domain-containing protein [Thermoplasmata archaeon]
MKKVRVSNIRNLITRDASVVREDDSLLKVAEEIVRDPRTRSVYVVDKSGKLMGIIPVIELIQYLYYEHIPQEYIFYHFPLALSGEPVAKDIMLSPVYVHDTDSVTDALKKMFKNNLEEIPVVDGDMKIIGDLNILELISAWIEVSKNAP